MDTDDLAPGAAKLLATNISTAQDKRIIIFDKEIFQPSVPFPISKIVGMLI